MARRWSGSALIGQLGLTAGLLAIVLVAGEAPARSQEIDAGEEKAKPSAADEAPDQLGLYGMMLAETKQAPLTVVSVSPASPAAKGGVREGDILLEMAGYAPASVTEASTFAKSALAKPSVAGAEIPFIFERAGAKVRVTVIAPEAPAPESAPPETAPLPPRDQTVFCLLLNDQAGYVLVKDVGQDTPAWAAGIRAGDIITSVAGRPVRSNVDLATLIDRQTPGERVSFRVLRGVKSLEAAVLMTPCQTPTAPAGGPPDLAALAAQLKVMQAQIEDLRRTAETLQASIELMSRGGQPTPAQP